MPTNKNIESPELLYSHFEKYKRYCKENPKRQSFWSSKSDKEVSISKEVPYTWDGFEIWLRKNKVISRLDDYKADKDGRYTEYAYIIRAIDQEIRSDKMDGAYAGVFQHNIVARDLGLSDNNKLEHTGPEGQPLTHKVIFENYNDSNNES